MERNKLMTARIALAIATLVGTSLALAGDGKSLPGNNGNGNGGCGVGQQTNGCNTPTPPVLTEPSGPLPINGDVPAGAEASFDPVYNVCRGVDPRCYHNWLPNRAKNKVLIFTRTAGPRHANLGTKLAAGRNPALGPNNLLQNTLIAWMAEVGVTADWTEDITQLSNLNNYAAVIFANNSRDAMWKHGTPSATDAVNTTTSAYLDAGKVLLRQYVRAGGGFVAIHNAYGTEYNWPWYEGLLGNANYYDHGAYQAGDVVIVNKDSSTDGVPARFAFRDEWYNLQPYPTRVKFLARVDDSTLANRGGVHPGHGDFHPVAWCQYYDGGRAWLTTLGHDPAAFGDTSVIDATGRAAIKQIIVNGILSAMGNKPFCTQS